MSIKLGLYCCLFLSVGSLIANLIPGASHIANLVGLMASFQLVMIYFIEKQIQKQKSEAPPSVIALFDVPVQQEQYPVTIQFLLSGNDYGHDAGLITFSDGWLVFDGLRTNIELRASDVSLPSDNGGQRETRLTVIRTGSSLVITPYEVAQFADGKLEGLRSKFNASFERWFDEQAPNGTPLLPVLAVAPELLTPPTAPMRFGWSMILLAGGTLLFVPGIGLMAKLLIAPLAIGIAAVAATYQIAGKRDRLALIAELDEAKGRV